MERYENKTPPKNPTSFVKYQNKIQFLDILLFSKERTFNRYHRFNIYYRTPVTRVDPRQGRPYEVRGLIGNKFGRPRFSVNLHQGLYLYVLDKARVDYTLARGPLRRGAQLGALGPIGLRPALMPSYHIMSIGTLGNH